MQAGSNPAGMGQGPMLGVSMGSAERQPARDRGEIAANSAFSASREGKRLNMLGFNSHLLERDAALNQQMPASTNERDHRDLSGLMGAYGSSQNEGAAQARHGYANQGSTRGDVGGLLS